MSDPSCLDPLPFSNFPEFNPSDLSFSDANLFPDGEFLLPEGLTSDLDLDDIDLDFSVDNLLLPSSDDGSVDPQSNSNSNSNVTANSNPGSPESGNNSSASGVAASQQVKHEEEKKSWMLKRKKGDNEEAQNPNLDPYADVSPSSNPSSRNLKLRRSDEATSSCSFNPGADEDEKRKVRLMRNRESAQLSRRRKKHYVEELEEKVKKMSSTIAELNGKITFFMSENVRLQQQLTGNNGGENGNGGKVKPPAVYPSPPPPMAPYPFPWIPYAGYPMMPNRSPVPYIPIPRLKPQQPASAPKAKSRKNENKTKKVASVSLLGLLFIMLVFGGITNFGLEGSGGKVSGGLSRGKDRILSVKGRENVINSTEDFCQFSGKMGKDNSGKFNRYQKEMKQNSSESLPALLYVSRNGKHVEINGNLIIHSVLASERAISQTKQKIEGKESSMKEGTGLAIPGNLASALAVPNGQREVGRHPKAYSNSAELQRALTSDPHDTYRDNVQSTMVDGPLQQWFREGLAGPILSSGTCTEVFQFDTSPSAAIVPATVVNATEKLPAQKKNRRIMYQLPIPLNGSAINNNTTNHSRKSSKSSETFHGNSSAPSMVVSVLADPREAGDGDGDEMITPKSLSRIFVVVLMDNVKYVTYSCVLPLKSHGGSHLVNLPDQPPEKPLGFVKPY